MNLGTTRNIFMLGMLLISTVTFANNNNKKKSSIPVMETGGQKMPDEWIDKDTGHRIIKLTHRYGTNASFYFNNNPFIGNEMIFKGSSLAIKGNDQYSRAEHKGMQQMYAVNLKTQEIRQITHEPFSVSTEIVCQRTHEMFFQHRDTVYACNTDNGCTRIVTIIPQNKVGGIVTVNSNGTLLAGTFSDPREGEILRNNPRKGDYFNMIFEAKLKKTLFTINTKTGAIDSLYSENAWLNHLQFSPADPNMLMFCHEGPWHKVDRIWTIDVTKSDAPRLMHKRTIDREIAGHEWWGADGKHIYFDLQKPRGKTFYVGKVNAYTGEEKDYQLTRDEWCVHYTSSWDESFLAGDGGNKISVANSDKDQWIFRFNYAGDKLHAEKIVNMKNQDYHLEPNVHFSLDDKWLIFRANFEGHEDIYAVEL